MVKKNESPKATKPRISEKKVYLGSAPMERSISMLGRSGPVHSPAGRTGFAHLFEHLMFIGSAHVPYPQFDTLMEAHGGQNNADTTQDRTRYDDVGPSNLLELFLYEEADRLATLAQTMTDAKVDAQ